MQFGALILKPILMGAGGMIFVDPLFQWVLVDVIWDNLVCWQNIGDQHSGEKYGLPVIFDKVFVGMYWLGQESCAAILDVYPNIAVFAKILTSGTLPLAVTLVLQPIFNTFYGKSKSEALHRHSYTAHVAGCEVANEPFKLLQKTTTSDRWMEMQQKWSTSNDKSQSVWSFFDPNFIESLSRPGRVKWAMSLGTVLAFRLVGENIGGIPSQSQQYLMYQWCSLLQDIPHILHCNHWDGFNNLLGKMLSACT